MSATPASAFTAVHPQYVAEPSAVVAWSGECAGDHAGPRSCEFTGTIGRGIHAYDSALEGAGVLSAPDPEVLATRAAPEVADELPSVIYREGTPRPGNLTPRVVDEGALSFRDSLSNPIGSAERPVLRPGEPDIGIETSRLPPGSVVVDNIPPGHVSVTGVSVEEYLAALIERSKFPK